MPIRNPSACWYAPAATGVAARDCSAPIGVSVMMYCEPRVVAAQAGEYNLLRRSAQSIRLDPAGERGGTGAKTMSLSRFGSGRRPGCARRLRGAGPPDREALGSTGFHRDAGAREGLRARLPPGAPFHRPGHRRRPVARGLGRVRREGDVDELAGLGDRLGPDRGLDGGEEFRRRGVPRRARRLGAGLGALRVQSGDESGGGGGGGREELMRDWAWPSLFVPASRKHAGEPRTPPRKARRTRRFWRVVPAARKAPARGRRTAQAAATGAIDSGADGGERPRSGTPSRARRRPAITRREELGPAVAAAPRHGTDRVDDVGCLEPVACRDPRPPRFGHLSELLVLLQRLCGWCG